MEGVAETDGWPRAIDSVADVRNIVQTCCRLLRPTFAVVAIRAPVTVGEFGHSADGDDPANPQQHP